MVFCMPQPLYAILEVVRQAAPPEMAADWDRIGLQVGDRNAVIETVFITLDVSRESLGRAAQNSVGLVIAHHPLIFEPLRQIDFNSSPGCEIATLIHHRMALFIAHTNVDASPRLSMNRSLGELLELQDIQMSAAPFHPPQMKLVTFVPEAALDGVRQGLSKAGAGEIGEYSECSFTTQGVGTFRGSQQSNPVIGSRGQLEKVPEARLEMIFPKKKIDSVLAALLQAHPYEEVAYDLYELSGYHSEKHFLWKGELDQEIPLEDFAARVRKTIGRGEAPVRFAGDPKRKVKKISWCSGGGKSLIRQLNASTTDVYVTGDTGHHDALNCLEKGICLVDVDHFYTERFFISNMALYLREVFNDTKLRVLEDEPQPVYRGV